MELTGKFGRQRNGVGKSRRPCERELFNALDIGEHILDAAIRLRWESKERQTSGCNRGRGSSIARDLSEDGSIQELDIRERVNMSLSSR